MLAGALGGSPAQMPPTSPLSPLISPGAGTSGAVISPYLSLISKSRHQRGGWRAAGVRGRQQERRPVGRAHELGDRRARLDAAAADRAQERRGRPVDADAGRSDGRWGGPVSTGCSGGQPGARGAGSGRRREVLSLSLIYYFLSSSPPLYLSIPLFLSSLVGGRAPAGTQGWRGTIGGCPSQAAASAGDDGEAVQGRGTVARPRLRQ